MVRRIDALYNDQGKLKGEHHFRGEEMLQRAHVRKIRDIMSKEPQAFKLTPGLRQAMKLSLIHNQTVHKYPWGVIFIDKKKHRRRKKFTFLSSAIQYQAKIAEQYPNATVVSLVRGYDVPHEFRGRLPKPWKWCPFCMKPRKYQAALNAKGERQTFYANVKVWNGTKGRYEWIDRPLLLMECPICKQTNRHHVFRRSNQPWEHKRISRRQSRSKRR